MKATTQKMTLALKNSHHEIVNFEKTKFLVGSHPSCDLKIEDSSISEIHAMITISSLGIEVQDLQSLNGIFVNGQRTYKAIVNEGDSLSFGGIHFTIIDTVESYEVLTHDIQVMAMMKEEEKIFVPKAHSEKAVLIDDEYCDIIFDEDERLLEDSPLHMHAVKGSQYIELDLSDKEYDIVSDNDEKAILITTLSNGVVINQNYFNLKEKTLFASGNIKKKNDLYVELLEPDARVPFLKFEKGEISVLEISDLKLTTTPLVGEGNVVILNYKSYQIMVELTDAPNSVKNIPFWIRETDFYKDAAKVFAGIFLPMLLLLLVDFSVEKEEEKKEVAIIYKKANPTNETGKEIAVNNPNSKTENTGHKPTPQQETLADAKKGAEKPTPKKDSAKMAKASSKPEPTKKAKAPVKAYEFNMKSNIKNLFSKTDVSNTKSARKSASVNTSTSSTSSVSDTRVAGQAGGEVGKLGLDNSGAARASGGARGLASKKGLETSYIEPRTVVLGSMDPELLRKILQEYLPQFRHCYQQELAYNSDDIQGIVDLNFEIQASGKVSKINIKTKDSRFSKKGVDCMGKVLSIINFPKPKGGGRVAVRQPLSFFSEKERG